MNTESKINVHHSSLVALKAELIRKQEEVEVAKAKLEVIRPIKIPKSRTQQRNENKKNKKLEQNDITNQPEDIDSMKILKKSKLMLEAKSRLYDRLSKTHVNMNPNFLVDFEHKPDSCDQLEEVEEDESYYKNDDDDSDDEWVEYTDCFGRTRKCLREDLPKMQEKDKFLKENIVEKSHNESAEQVMYVEDRIPEKEPEIEMMRRKWEEQTAALAQKADIHYEDILFDEARTHGVGYYAFSRDEEERAKQQANLLNLRKETEQKQKEKQEVQDIKNKIEQNRLRVARLRQRIRAGLPAEESEEHDVNNIETPSKLSNDKDDQTNIEHKENDTSIESNNSLQKSKQEIAKSKLIDIENKIQAFGELLGKRNQWYVMSQEEWVHKKRKERIGEFAPKYDNFQSGETYNVNSSTSKSIDEVKPNEYLEEGDSDIIGPMPSFSNSSTNVQVLDSCAEDSTDPAVDANVDIANQIEAGLKFLRQQFEKKST